MGLYRMKPIAVEAIEVDKVLSSPENDWTGLPDWLREGHASGQIWFKPDCIEFDVGEPNVTGIAPKGGWLIRGADGKLWGNDADFFDATYERVPDEYVPAVQASPRYELVGEPFNCGSRVEQGRVVAGVLSDHWRKMPNGDRTCSYCGSLHEDDLFEILQAYADGKEGYSFDPTTKPYKKYASRPGVSNASEGGIKFYGWHADLTEGPELDRKNEIYNRAMQRFHNGLMKSEEVGADG